MDYRKKKELSRRNFLKASGVLTGATLLGANGANLIFAQGDDPVSITFWTPGGSDPYCQGFNVIAANFMEQNPNIQMGETQCNPTGENYNEVFFANIASGNPPDASIVWASPVSFATRGAVLPLDDLMSLSNNSQIENWPEGVLASCQYDGQTFGLPASASPYAMYYNTDMFEEAGISTAREDFPKTWDELRQLSKEFTRWNGDVLETAGYLPWGDTTDFFGMAVQFAVWSATNGGQVYDAENQLYSIDSEANIEMMQYALDWWEEEYRGDLIQVSSSANWGAYPDGEGRPGAFPSGKLAILNNGYWIATDMYAGADDDVAGWDVARFPVGPSGTESASGYWPNWVVIPTGVPHPQESFDFLDYLVVEGMSVWFNIVPDLPANEKFPSDFVPQGLINVVGEEKATDVNTFFTNQLNDAVPMWNSPVEDFYLDQISRALEQIIGKSASPEEALGEAQQLTQRELERVLSS